ncbi:MAG TPA: anaerobic ribonucleoside-triphosphate reductase, partial [Candidatus Aenigmarchaeota archaeon]|nr:anaerobic ribonucleoside-triphosphate reductase [Candidatus Aenigmarchaeota archaeon]
MKETGLKEEVAEKIAKEAEEEIKRMNLEFVSAPLVREVVCIKLLEHGLEEERKKYTRLGRPVYDVTQMIFTKDKENANTFYNPEFVHKELGSAISKEYALLHVIPLEASDAHMRGEIHIHTLEYFITRPFCFEHSMHYFLINGVKTDGRGIFTAVPKPPKHLDAAMMQLAKVLQMSQMVFSGGQGFDSFNVFLAPYAKGLSYEEIKQAVQY